MHKNKYAFSIIEVVVATFILSIAVFGVYKLISENTKIINNSETKTQASFLFSVVKNCIKNSNSSGYLDLGKDLKSCNFEKTEKINTIDNIDYILKYENNIISIKSETIGTLSGFYENKK